MSYRQYTDFEKSLIKSPTYQMYEQEALQKGLIRRRYNPGKFMSTPKTWRACKSCTTDGSSRVQAHREITGQISLIKCLGCGGKGMVYG